MGVDAEMFVRIGAGEKHLSEAIVLELACKLAKTVGHDKFFIQHEELAGLKPAMFGWTPHHALSIMQPIKDAKDAEDYGLDETMIGRVVYTQDGDPIIANPHEQFIRVHLWSRYYGPEYERGDWPSIYATMRFLWGHIPRGVTYYGGDSSGICAEPFGEKRAEEMDRYYLTYGHEPYRAYFGNNKPNTVRCRCCKVPMHAVGGGPDVDFFSCDGCGWHMVQYKATKQQKWGPAHVRFRDLMKKD